jgi:homoserine kinase
LLGVAAIISAVGGAGTTILALRKAKSEEHEECLKHLKAAREEGEQAAAELHEMRMREAQQQRPPYGLSP